MKDIKRYIPGKTVVSASDINAIAAELVRQGRLTVAPPLVLAETPAGPVLGYPKMPVVRPALIKEDAGAWGVISAVLVEYDGAGNIEEGESIYIRVPNVHTEGGHYWDQLAPFLKTDALVFVIREPHGSLDIIERAAAEVWTRWLALPPFVPADWHIAVGIGSVFATHEDTHVSGSITADRAIRIVKASRPDHGGIQKVKCRSSDAYDELLTLSCTDTDLCVRRMNGRLAWERYFGRESPPTADLYDAAFDSAQAVIVVGDNIPQYGTEAPPPIAWVIDTSYVTNDVVVYRGIRYECLSNHTSDLSNRPRSDKWDAKEYVVIDAATEVFKYDSSGAVQWSVGYAGAGGNGDDIIPRAVTCIGTTIYWCGEEYNTTTNTWWGHIYKLNGSTGATLTNVAFVDYRWRCIDNDGTDIYVGGSLVPTPATSRLTKRAGGDLSDLWGSPGIKGVEGEMVTQVSVGDVLLWYLADRASTAVPPRVFGANYLSDGFGDGYGWCYFTAVAASGEGNWQHPEAEPEWRADQERIYVGSNFWRPPPWSAATSYSPQDVVRYGTASGADKRWRCWLATTGGSPGPDPPPADAAHWKAYAFVNLNVPDKWKVGETYEEDDGAGEGTLVRDLGLRYRCYDDHTPASVSDRPKDNIPSKWRAEPYQSDYFMQKILVGYHDGNPEAGDPPGSYGWPTTTYWTKFTRGAPGSIMRK